MVTELALGTWGLSGEGYGMVNESDADATIERAVELGINLFDTSDAYQRGEMEARLGRILEPFTDRTRIVTRHGVDRASVPPRKRFDREYLEESIGRTLERLKRPSIDVFLLHNPSVDTLVQTDVLAFLKEKKDKGVLRAYGVSAGDAEVGRVAIDLGVDVISIAYNVFLPDLHRLASDIVRSDIGVLAHSVLAYGMLVGMWHHTKKFAPGDHRKDRWAPQEMEARMTHMEAARSLVGGDVHSLRSGALRYVLSNHTLTSAILGPRNVAQLEQLVRDAGNGPPYLDEERLSQLPAKLAAAGVET
jgi:aryl-alcohol dehydrogenase-like predicted oxidoreductase